MNNFLHITLLDAQKNLVAINIHAISTILNAAPKSCRITMINRDEIFILLSAHEVLAAINAQVEKYKNQDFNLSELFVGQYFLYNKNDNHVMTNGAEKIKIYDSIKEAESESSNNFEIVTFAELPKEWKKQIFREINQGKEQD